jgi:hypothetical protein
MNNNSSNQIYKIFTEILQTIKEICDYASYNEISVNYELMELLNSELDELIINENLDNISECNTTHIINKLLSIKQKYIEEFNTITNLF